MHTPATDDQWISFRLEDELYAQPIATVKEVIEFANPAPVPGSPSVVEGVLNVRGEVITVLSGHRLLNADSHSDRSEQRILIIDGDDERFGVIVDAVDAIVHLPEERIERNTQTQSAFPLVGTARHQERLLILLDLTESVTLN